MKNGDAYAYADSATTVKIPAAALKEIFVKGAIIIDAAGAVYKPVSFHMDTTVGTVVYIKPNGTTPTSADLAEIKSSEFAG